MCCVHDADGLLGLRPVEARPAVVIVGRGSAGLPVGVVKTAVVAFPQLTRGLTLSLLLRIGMDRCRAVGRFVPAPLQGREGFNDRPDEDGATIIATARPPRSGG